MGRVDMVTKCGWGLRALAVPTLIFASACAGARAGQRPSEVDPGGTVITREEIRSMGVHNALEALERAKTSLVIQRTRNGSPVRIYHRGVDSLMLRSDIQVVVDGAMVQDGILALENIPASTILFIQVLSGREAAMKYGSSAGNGVVTVRTGAG